MFASDNVKTFEANLPSPRSARLARKKRKIFLRTTSSFVFSHFLFSLFTTGRTLVTSKIQFAYEKVLDFKECSPKGKQSHINHVKFVLFFSFQIFHSSGFHETKGGKFITQTSQVDDIESIFLQSLGISRNLSS